MTYEVEAAVLGGLVGAVLGILGAYALDIRKAERVRQERAQDAQKEKRRHRATIATALLQDCRRLEFAMRELYDSSMPTRAAVSRHTLFYDALRAEIRWMAPTSVQPLAEFYRRVDHVYGMFKVLRELGSGHIQATPQRDFEIRTHAAFVLQALPAAVQVLKDEGGVVPAEMIWEASTYPTLPSVPGPIFDDAVARENQKRKDANAHSGV